MTIATGHVTTQSLTGEVVTHPPARLSIVVALTGSRGTCPRPVSRQWLPPRGASLSSCGVPVSPVPPLSAVLRRRYDFRSACPWSLIWFASTAHGLPLRSCSPQRSRKLRGCLPSQGACLSGRPNCRLRITWTRMGYLRSPGDPSCASAPLLGPGRTDVSSPFRPHRCCPRYPYSEGFGNCYFGAHSRSFGTC
jgi:hypothetical protein